MEGSNGRLEGIQFYEVLHILPDQYVIDCPFRKPEYGILYGQLTSIFDYRNFKNETTRLFYLFKY
jgi:hypothetical protein